MAMRPMRAVVCRRVLELRQVERGGVTHEADAHGVREQVAEQRLDERRGTREEFAENDDPQLNDDHVPERREGATRCSRQAHHLVDDELRDPE